MDTNEDLQELGRQRLEAKAAEDKAAEHRKNIDARIAAHMAKLERTGATATAKLDGFKITTTFGFETKADTAALQRDWEKIPEGARMAFEWAAKLKGAIYKELPEGLRGTLAPYLTTKAKSPTVTVEVAK